jgi:hypothetical protein
VHYDATVRNAAGGIVQFAYGDDGLDPVVMEGKDGKPLDFERLLAKVRGSSSSSIALRQFWSCVVSAGKVRVMMGVVVVCVVARHSICALRGAVHACKQCQ